MRARRGRLSERQYQELVDARNWCRLNGLPGAVWYDIEIDYLAKRGYLPEGAPEARRPVDDEERPRGRRER